MRSSNNTPKYYVDADDKFAVLALSEVSNTQYFQKDNKTSTSEKNQ